MTFIDHGVQHGLILALPAKLAGVTDWVVWVLFGVGFLVGAWPDMNIRLEHGKFITDWDSYVYRHTAPVWYYRLHQWVDAPFHRESPNWWPRLWWLASIWWVVELAGLWVLACT